MIALIVLLLLTGLAIWFMTKDMVSILRPATGGVKSDNESKESSVGQAFLVGVVGTMALISIVSGEGSGVAGGTVAAAGAIVSVLSTFAFFLRQLRDWFFGAVGAIAAIPVMVSFITGDLCVPVGTSPIHATVVGVVLLLCFGLAYFFTRVIPNLGITFILTDFPLVGLQLFSAVELVLFLNSPLGYSIVGDTPLFLTSLVGSVFFGILAASRYTEVTFGAAGVAILASAFLSDDVGASCTLTPGTDPAIALTILASYIACFIVTRWFFGLYRKKAR